MTQRQGCLTRAVVLALALSAAPAHAGVVRGSVRVPGGTAVAPSFNAYPGRASALPGSHGTPRGAVTDAVLSIERIPAAVESTLATDASRPRLAQQDQAFVPRVIPVAVGGSVDFPNLDPIYHNVFSVSPTQRFDLGKYPRGQSKRVRFPKVGLVNVFCDIHSDMAAFILVLPNHAFTQPAADGRFVLPDLPPGRYLLKWWHPDFTAGSRDVEVPASGDVEVEVRF